MKLDAKVELRREKVRVHEWDPGYRRLVIVRCLPFYRSGFGKYIHRVRSGNHHFRDDRYGHTTLTLWCGMIGHLGGRRWGRSELFAAPPDHAEVCATCEGRAIGAGQLGSREICGRTVMFSPRS